MKRNLISIIAMLLLCAMLAGCVADTAQSEDPASSADPGTSSEGASSDEASRDDTSSGDTSSEPEPEPSKYYTSVSLGKPYTIKPEPSETYPDSYGTELTDGISALEASYGSAEACGFTANPVVTIDLGDVGKKINRVTVEYLATREAGLGPLGNGTVYGSNDGEKFDYLGKLTVPEYVDGTVQVATLDLDRKPDYRYIRVMCVKTSAWLFLSEVTVFADVEPSSVSDTLQKIDEIFKNDGISSADRISALQAAASGKELDRTLIETLISKGKSYTLLSAVYDDRAEDEGKKMLTDGSDVGSAFDSGFWVGLGASTENEITINMGKSATDASRFVLYAYSRPNVNIHLPLYVDVYVGESKKEMHFIGRAYAAPVTDGNFKYEISLSCCVNAAYVKFAIPANDDGGYYWFEEAAVYAYREPDAANAGMVYDPLVLPTVKKDEYWPSSASDYDKEQNLLLGLPQQIVSEQALLKSEYGGTNQNTPASSTWLTDGKHATTLDCYRGNWFHFMMGRARTVVYDLGKVSAVSSYSFTFLQYPEWAIQVPNEVKLLLSTDGENWYTVSAKSYTNGSGNKSVEFKAELDKAYKARFVAIDFTMVTNHCFADEFEVYGTKNASKAVALSDSGIKSEKLSHPMDEGYQAPSAELLGGVRDVMLIYHNSPSYTYDKDFFLPYVAYLDKDGKILDTMYDGYLFLPTAPGMVKGNATGENYKEDWDGLFDSMFKKGYGLDALEAAAAETATALGKSDYKVKFYPTLIYISPKVTNFGDVDGDGVTESFATLEGRLKVVKWYVERVNKEFAARGYQHIELCGWYWYQEAIITANDDKVTIPAISEYLHSIGTQFFWIPYYCATGYGDWKELGFDVCCMQPNFAFSTDVPASRIETAAKIIKLYGMCVEMEISGAALTDMKYFNKYMDYLGGGIEFGYINDCIRMYYQDVDVIAAASRSKSPLIRLIYEYSYQLLKGTLKAPETPEAQTVTVKAGEICEGTLGDYDVAKVYRLEISAEHGCVTINDDGTFRYYPDEGFTGTDTFTFSVGNRVAWSGTCTVTINVQG